MTGTNKDLFGGTFQYWHCNNGGEMKVTNWKT